MHRLVVFLRASLYCTFYYIWEQRKACDNGVFFTALSTVLYDLGIRCPVHILPYSLLRAARSCATVFVVANTLEALELFFCSLSLLASNDSLGTLFRDGS